MFVNSPLFSEQGNPEQEENSILDIPYPRIYDATLD